MTDYEFYGNQKCFHDEKILKEVIEASHLLALTMATNSISVATFKSACLTVMIEHCRDNPSDRANTIKDLESVLQTIKAMG